MSAPRACTRTRKRAPRPRLPLFTGELVTAAELPDPKEIALQCALADFLTDWCRIDWEWTHFPAGELRAKRTAEKLQRMGTKPGWPDLILVSPEGVFHGLELKRRGKTLNENQEAFHARARARGWKIAVADTFDDARANLQGWGCLRIKFAEVRA
ncbi:VRR-NUC domain-containing protein [Microvirga sp. BSC39]|uniref:VRR-NUC domain-containing protein n=1 Tax=Microvirga sp. BSC39 TaxID=1549810 RepID=UPI0004E8B70A|nr:VRR-NUC domain-containing protein [Microvirga sp. BSC39]KFG68682.1 hypothetical protein JH26_14495 [Microvirga sp. BSC39]